MQGIAKQYYYSKEALAKVAASGKEGQNFVYKM